MSTGSRKCPFAKEEGCWCIHILKYGKAPLDQSSLELPTRNHLIYRSVNSSMEMVASSTLLSATLSWGSPCISSTTQSPIVFSFLKRYPLKSTACCISSRVGHHNVIRAMETHYLLWNRSLHIEEKKEVGASMSLILISLDLTKPPLAFSCKKKPNYCLLFSWISRPMTAGIGSSPPTTRPTH